ncbi:MAG: hypothetical protein M1840_005581 [Geoglossum simile]|nr:MAG: hypothetical protein M1840_005581 [Geoglossum simile]
MSFFSKLNPKKSGKAGNRPHEVENGKPNRETYGLFTLGDVSQVRDYNSDIIAVHGLGGDWEKTWTDENGKHWLRDFLPSQIPTARIMSYGYNSKTAFSKAATDIDDEAKMLLDRIHGERQTEGASKRPIIFVSHSLGGIVVKKVLIIAHERSDHYGRFLNCVQGVVFLGVPHRGSDLAYWGTFAANLLYITQLGFGTNPAFVDALRRNSETLANISEQFIERGSRLQIRTFYETDKLGNKLIVDRDSACLRLPNEIAVGIPGSNHVSLCRFDHADSQKYAPVWRAIKALADVATVKPTSSSHSLPSKEVECLQSLYVSDYESHKNRNPARVAGTCEWFLQHEKYKCWREGQASGLLWVSANPGCGKSVLSSFLVDELRSAESQAMLPGTVCHFFFKDDNDTQKSATLALCALLHQLFTAKSSLIKHAKMESEKKGQIFSAEFGSLWRILLAAAADPDCGGVMCVLDGLDECEEPTRVLLLDSLAKLYVEYRKGSRSKNSLKFIVTSRPYPSIERRFYKNPTVRLRAEDEASSTSEDIERVVKARVKEIGLMRSFSDAVQADVEKSLVRNADRTFLWISLILEMIETSVRASKGTLNTIINTIPTTLDAAYDRILQKSPNLEEARKLLHIIVGAARPLTLEEMNVAFNINPSDRSHEDLDLEPSIEATVKGLCGSFVRVIDSKIYLVHQTAKEYLTSDSAAPVTGTWKHSLHPLKSNLILAEICVSYLLFDVFESQPLVIASKEGERAQVAQYISKYEFLDYAARNWAAHFRAAHVREDVALFSSVLGIYTTRSRGFLTWIRIYWVFVRSSSQIPQNFTNLMVASYFGHEAVARVLLVKNGADPTAKDGDGWTALHWAAREGHDAVALLLVGQGAETDTKNCYEKTALHLAASVGHIAVMQVLVEAGANIDAVDKHNYNVLNAAAESGSEPAVRLLLERGVNTAERGYVALQNAGLRGHDRIVRLLLDEGVDANKQGRDGWTGLHRAALMNKPPVVRLLLDKGADPNMQDSEGGTALQFAAMAANKEMVQLLLNSGADVAMQSSYGGTALHHAVSSGKEGVEEVARLLLSAGANVDARDNGGRTPLHLGMCESAIELLLESGADIEAKDKRGRTPLHDAAVLRKESAVRLLLEKKADPNAKDDSGDTALSLVQQSNGRSGSEAVVCLLLRAGADVAGLAGHGSTALHWAATGGYEAVTQLLLEMGTNLEVKDGCGRTSLHRAAESGSEEVLRLLMNKGADVDEKDSSGCTALSLALSQQHMKEAVVRLLVEAGAEVSAKAKDGSTALHWSTSRGYEAIARLLLGRGADIETKDSLGRTAVDLAFERGHTAVVETLLEYHEEHSMPVCEGSMDAAAKSRLPIIYIYCDGCNIHIPDTEPHYHCSICNNGDFDLCQNCTNDGISCRSGGHMLIKRCVKNGLRYNVTGEECKSTQSCTG